ncbi:Tti2 family protein [Aspergillus mulundensis]|uniref:Uncharacterized protein n=1 Tax=Aspergillus mulundensis TaxID=1810919 RepID=A0A3D8RYS5_9EURO|nr:Uncharacterized protein DSM5745_06044 [Aspergillus mulundensis]RDW79192.1 Uncharacterized protein DSM5745_06044 [Aspergillus mulundensis]
MERLRTLAHESLRQSTIAPIADSVLDGFTGPTVTELWQAISTKLDNNEALQNLLVAEACLRKQACVAPSELDKRAINSLYNWASELALPLPVFAESSEDSSSKAQEDSRQQSTLAVSVILSLNALLPLEQSDDASNVVIALGSFTSEPDAWNTHDAFTASTALLRDFVEKAEPLSFWMTVESILKNRVRPLFAKSKNPAITESGRKNFHPVPLPRFDLSILDPETKPWKNHDGYITTVFSWIVKQYKPGDSETLEAHFPLLVPPILALIDDDSNSYKRLGCVLLSQFLIPIRACRSDILRRTNLSSVFEDAVRPLFHSLPTITQEDDSIQLLGEAYPAFRSLLQISYRLTPAVAKSQRQNTPAASAKRQKDEETFIAAMTRTLRDHLIPSFHHISSTNTTAPGSHFASFPHSRLSTLLLNQIAVTCAELKIHTTKYLQDIIPLIYSTLSNPFGTAHPPLLLSSLSVTRAVLLNAYPRVWRWRGELLGAICSCWLHILEDEEESKGPYEKKAADLEKLKKELQGSVYLLRYVLEHPLLDDNDQGQLEAKENISKEMQILVDADESLKACLFADVDPGDPSYFGYDS